MEEPQYCRCNQIAIVLQICSLCGLICVVFVLNAAALDPHLNLLQHHALIKCQMRLSGEDAVLDIYALDLGVFAPAPHLHLGLWTQQAIRGRRGGSLDDVILMHLVKVDLVVRGAEETLSDVVQVDDAVAELPLARRAFGNLGAEEPAEELMPETDPRKQHFGVLNPQLYEKK